MSINKTLAEERGISQEDQDKIEELHNLLENLINSAVEEGYPDERKIINLIQEAEYMLQALRNLPCDRKYHTWFKNYLFRSEWVGRKFECKDTGVVFTIPSNVSRGDFFKIGNGFVDVGDGYYSRKGGNVVEII